MKIQRYWCWTGSHLEVFLSSHTTTHCLLAVCLSAAAVSVRHWCLFKLNKILLQTWPCLNFSVCWTEYCTLKDTWRSWNGHLWVHTLVFSSYVNAFFSAAEEKGFFNLLLYYGFWLHNFPMIQPNFFLHISVLIWRKKYEIGGPYDVHSDFKPMTPGGKM